MRWRLHFQLATSGYGCQKFGAFRSITSWFFAQIWQKDLDLEKLPMGTTSPSFAIHVRAEIRSFKCRYVLIKSAFYCKCIYATMKTFYGVKNILSLDSSDTFLWGSCETNVCQALRASDYRAELAVRMAETMRVLQSTDVLGQLDKHCYFPSVPLCKLLIHVLLLLPQSKGKMYPFIFMFVFLFKSHTHTHTT